MAGRWIVGKKKPQHEQQIGCILPRSKLMKTAQICDDHISHGQRAAFQVQQITREQQTMFSRWTDPTINSSEARPANAAQRVTVSQSLELHDDDS
jgi:hypothetical protein